jgi:hypothetical protein
MNATWQALSREASLAAEQMGMGVTVLAKANYAHHAHYPQAFFALSIGMERAAKLALLLEHAIRNEGHFPASRQLRDYGHNLKNLLRDVDQIDVGDYKLPATPIHVAILDTLSEFAMNITRYYNQRAESRGASCQMVLNSHSTGIRPMCACTDEASG